MNRTDRLLAIVLELQGRGKRRAQDLADTFEVSKRTIYRDIEALCEAGVPVAAAPGQGYKLIEGYFLPPLSFSADEAIILTLGSQVMRGSFDAQYGVAAESAGRKIMGVLPEQLRAEVAYLLSSIHFVVPSGMPNSPTNNMMLQIIRGAIVERRTVQFLYYPRHRKDDMQESEKSNASQSGDLRKVDPYALIHVAGSWYVAGYDHKRREKRTFRLDRIEHFEILKETFTRSGDFKLERGPEEDRKIVVRVLFSSEAIRWVHESPSFFIVSEELTEKGLLVTLRVRHEREVVQWLLGWGRHVRVLEPESLRQMMAEEAEELVKNHIRS